MFVKGTNGISKKQLSQGCFFSDIKYINVYKPIIVLYTNTYLHNIDTAGSMGPEHSTRYCQFTWKSLSAIPWTMVKFWDNVGHLGKR